MFSFYFLFCNLLTVLHCELCCNVYCTLEHSVLCDLNHFLKELDFYCLFVWITFVLLNSNLCFEMTVRYNFCYFGRISGPH